MPKLVVSSVGNSNTNISPIIKGIVLPEEYTRLEYIESSGTQWIEDTTLVNNFVTGAIEVKLDLSRSNSGRFVGFTPTGSATSDRYTIFGSLAVIASNHDIAMCYSNYTQWSDKTDNNIDLTKVSVVKYDFTSGSQKLYIDGDYNRESTFTASPTATNYTFKMFKIHKDDGYQANARVYYAKVYKGTELVRHYIPAKRNSDNVLGMYEVKTGIFLTNQGSGTFTAGSEISETSNEYIPVEYIESTGTQYIDTKIILSNYTNPKLVFTGYLKNTNSGSMMLGTYNSTTPPHIFFINGNDSVTNVVIDYDSNSQQIKYELPFNPLSKHTYYCKYTNSSVKFALAVDTEDYTQYEEKTYSGLTSVYPLYLFGRNTSGTTALSATVFYEFKFYDGNTLLHNFIPVKRKSDDVLGLFDTISREFYTNAGTGDFIAGPEFQYVEVQYVEATGSQYADTNIIPDSNSKVEAKFSLNSLNATQCLVGTRNFNGLGYNSFSIFSDFYADNSNNMRFDYDNDWKLSIEPLVNVDYTVAKAQEKNYVNGSEITSNTQSTFSCVNSLYVFSLHSTENPFYMNGKLYYLKIWNGEDLVANIIPIKRKFDDTGFLYNTINHELLIYNDVLVAGPNKRVKSVSPGVPAKIVKINLPSVRKYKLFDRVKDDSNNVIGTVSGFFTKKVEGHGLPSEYQELEYLQTSGQTTINTNYYPKADSTKIVTKVDFLGTEDNKIFTSGTYEQDLYQLQRLNSTHDNKIRAYYFSTAGSGDFNSTSSYTTSNNPVYVEFDKHTLNINGSTIYSFDTKSTSSSGPLYIFQNDGSTTNMNMYYFGIYENEALVHYYVPAKRNLDSVLGMYDLVNNVFYTNTGSGTFTAGPYVIPDNMEYAVVCLDAQHRSNSDVITYDDNTVKMIGIPTLTTSDYANIYELPQTATENTDAIIRTVGTGTLSTKSPAVNFCRSKSFVINGITYYGQLPNAYELIDILFNRTELNNRDTTTSSYSSLILPTYKNINSSTQIQLIDNTIGRIQYRKYGILYGWRNDQAGYNNDTITAPVLEIPNLV